MLDLKQLKRIRESEGLTQKQLASLSGISQSLIAKVESGLVDPSYSNFKKIEHALTLIKHQNEPSAHQIMNNKIISVAPSASGKEIAVVLAKHAISQVPVLENNTPIGLISETDLLKAGANLKNKSAADLMQNPPPIIPEDTCLSVLTALLIQHSLILVSKKGHLSGVITKADIIKGIMNKN